MEIYIVRHGETLWNKSKRLQGNRNIDLSEVGRNEARERGKQLENVDFDVIYSSPLNRAYETACIIKGERNIPIIKDDRLREINFGINEGMQADQLKKDKSNSFCKFFDDPGHYIPPGLCLGYRLLDALHDGGEIEVRQLVNLIEHKRHEQRAQRAPALLMRIIGSRFQSS